MNNSATKTIIFPELTANLLYDGCTLVDNIFANLWNQMGTTAKMKRWDLLNDLVQHRTS